MASCRTVLALAVMLAGCCGLGGCVVTVSERDLLRPRKHDLSHWRRPPGPGGVQVRPVRLDGDGPALRGWLFAPPAARRRMVYFYGNGESVLATSRRLARLASVLHCEILAVDYRGYGFSEGEPSFDAILADGLRAYDHLRRGSSAGEGPRPLVYGRSIGATVAVHVAAGRRPSGVILEAPPTSAAEVIPGFASLLPVPARWFVWTRPSAAIRSRRPQPVTTIRKVTAPLLVIHGADDRVIPIRFGRRMYEMAGSRFRAMLEVPGADHNNLNVFAPRVVAAMKRLLSVSHNDLVDDPAAR